MLKWKPQNRLVRLGILSCLIVCSVFALFMPRSCGEPLWKTNISNDGHLSRAKTSTLVVYVFSPTDAEYGNNLAFFVQNAVKENDNCVYYIIIQTTNDGYSYSSEGFAILGEVELLQNVHVIRKRNSCYDIGTVGWLLRQIDLLPYQYYFWINSSVRGPFLPVYATMHWTDPFVSKINENVKLVGCTINCQIQPHVQSYVVATDKIGIDILMQSERVFKCYDELQGVIDNSEIGASAEILKAGYNIDSLMVRYQGVDWHSQLAQNCNQKYNPLEEFQNDGTPMHIFEVLFVKVKEAMDGDKVKYLYAAAAKKYSTWIVNPGSRL